MICNMLLVFLVLYQLKIVKTKQNNLSKNTALATKGICAYEIMLGHIGIATGSLFLYPNRKAGILIVGVFFLLSGYGLRYSLEHKENYLNQFHWKLLDIFFPSYLVYILMLLIEIPSRTSVSLNEVIRYFALSEFGNKMNWYIFEILALYMLFYLCYTLAKNYAIKIILFASVMFVGLAFFVGLDNPWYGSTLCFPLGILYADYEQQINNIFKKKYVRKGIILVTLLFVSIIIFFLYPENFVSNVLARTAASISFSLLLIMVYLKVEIGNKYTYALGKISYEIFLIHPFVLSYFRDRIENNMIYTAICIVITIGGATLVHIILDATYGRLKGWIKKQEM